MMLHGIVLSCVLHVGQEIETYVFHSALLSNLRYMCSGLGSHIHHHSGIGAHKQL